MLKSEIIKCVDGILEFVDPKMKKETTTYKDRPYSHGHNSSEFFFMNSGEQLTCSLLDTYIDFGSCSTYRTIEPRSIRVANHTKGKMTCVWIEDDERYLSF
jgi:hypothetical protein